MGKGAALRRGFAAAAGDFVVVQDADLEYSPDDWDLLLAPLVRGDADVVYGSRFVSGQPRRVLFFWHAVGNQLLTLLSNAFTGLNLTDMETCYKAFRREVIQSITIEEDRFGFEPEITPRSPPAGGGCGRSGSPTRAAPTRRARRSAGATGSPRWCAS